jgi:hypothetical protein
MPDSFSEHHGYARQADITVREGAPDDLRSYILLVANSQLDFSWFFLEKILCLALKEPSQGSEHDYQLRKEVGYRLGACDWFKVYDFIQVLYDHIDKHDGEYHQHRGSEFTALMNSYFVEKGIGWQLVNGKVITRGGEAFEGTVKTAIGVLKEVGRPTAASHLHNAIVALSVRPNPNTAGAVSHATSAVECVLGDVTTQSGMTFSEYLKQHPNLFHGALSKGLDRLYGYASDEGARHGKEGTLPKPEDAEFVVATCAAVCTLLTRKHGGRP